MVASDFVQCRRSVQTFSPRCSLMLYPLAFSVKASLVEATISCFSASYTRLHTMPPNRRLRSPWVPFSRLMSHRTVRVRAFTSRNPITFSMNKEMGPSADHPQKSGLT